MAEDKRPKFFQDVHALAMDQAVVAYVVVGVVTRDGVLSIATGAGSRLADTNDLTFKVYDMMERAFEQAMVSLVEPEPDPTPPKGGLLN